MLQRRFLKSFTTLISGLTLLAIAHTKLNRLAWKTLQTSPLARFQYYHGETLWPQFAIGQTLTLVHEADNPYDERAVRIDWHDHKLGYIPRIDNAASRNCWIMARKCRL